MRNTFVRELEPILHALGMGAVAWNFMAAAQWAAQAVSFVILVESSVDNMSFYREILKYHFEDTWADL